MHFRQDVFYVFVWFWHGFFCKDSTKDEQSLHVKIQKSRTTFHNVCLFACCQLGLSIILESIAELPGPCYYRYSGKLWLAQKLKVCMIKHPQGFREGGVRGGRERVHPRGRPPWPFEAHFAQKVRQSRSHELPLPKKSQKDSKKYWQGCHIGRFIEILRKNGTQRTPKVV